MSLKQIIHKKKILRSAAEIKMTLPEEPMIYSIKNTVNKRFLPLTHFRNKGYNQLMKAHFQSYNSIDIPVVLFLTFFVSPPASIKVSAKLLEAEKTPAVHSHELCEYILSFVEMLYQVLFKSYRQIVKLEVEKFYSDSPRTEFQFLKWDHYVQCKAFDSRNATPKGISEADKERQLLF